MPLVRHKLLHALKSPHASGHERTKGHSRRLQDILRRDPGGKGLTKGRSDLEESDLPLPFFIAGISAVSAGTPGAT